MIAFRRLQGRVQGAQQQRVLAVFQGTRVQTEMVGLQTAQQGRVCIQQGVFQSRGADPRGFEADQASGGRSDVEPAAHTGDIRAHAHGAVIAQGFAAIQRARAGLFGRRQMRAGWG